MVVPIANASFHDLRDWASIAAHYKDSTGGEGKNVFIAFGIPEYASSRSLYSHRASC
jgi:hypothetical protein